MDLQESIEKVLTGNCMLFTGSGFSYESTNLLNANPKVGTSLCEFLYKECNISENDYDLKSASEFYLETHGEHQLIELLKKEYTISSFSEYHEFIASLPWKRIYTTNYDNCLELAFAKHKKILTPVILNDKIDHYKDKRTLCLHLNGFIERLNPTSLGKDFKLTNSSYLTTEFLSSTWIDLLRNDLETCSSVIFIGFSLNGDLDIARVISNVISKNKVFFVVKPGESTLNIKKLEKYGTPIDCGLNGYVDKIKEISKNFVPPSYTELDLKSFSKVKKDIAVPVLRDIDVFDLFFKGSSNTGLLHYSLIDNSKYSYYIKRNKIDSVVNYITNGGRNILIHSDLGNGKTLFLQGLANELAKIDFNVYFFKKYYDITNSEIEKICSSKEKAVLIFENYSSQFNLLKKLSLFRTADTIVIVSERSTVNDTAYPSLEQIIFKERDHYKTIDLNRLKTEEIAQLSDLLTKYGLWGSYSNLSMERKRQIIVYDCHSSFRLLLLKLLESADIKSRFDELMTSIKSADESFFKATLLILASNIFGFNMDLESLVYILDDDLLINPSFNNNDHLLEIIDFQNYDIKVKSSILSQSLLSKKEFQEELIPLLIEVVKKLDKRRYDQNNYDILKKIVSFSNLSSIFAKSETANSKQLIFNFFEEIKNTQFASKNPFFWLQYAIARLSKRDYPTAGLLFKTAYSFADSNPDFDAFHIDNHFARHILENEIYHGDSTTCMEQFLKSHIILSKRGDILLNRHYPFRVAALYGKFFDRFFKELKEQDQKVFLVSVNEMIQKVDEYKRIVAEDRWNKSVINCETELVRILKNNTTVS